MREQFIGFALFLAAAATLSASPFTNGSFESASVDPGGGFSTLASGSTAITGWMVGGNGIDYIGGYWSAFDGTRSLDMNALTLGSISQDFDTMVGQTYLVTFYMSKNPGASSAAMDVSAAGSTTGYSFSAANDVTNMLWAQNTFQFIATSAITTLSFTATSPEGGFGPALDAVSVVAGVPEPGTLTMMLFGIGIGAIGLWKRKRS